MTHLATIPMQRAKNGVNIESICKKVKVRNARAFESLRCGGTRNFEAELQLCLKTSRRLAARDSGGRRLENYPDRQDFAEMGKRAF